MSCLLFLLYDLCLLQWPYFLPTFVISICVFFHQLTTKHGDMVKLLSKKHFKYPHFTCCKWKKLQLNYLIQGRSVTVEPSLIMFPLHSTHRPGIMFWNLGSLASSWDQHSKHFCFMAIFNSQFCIQTVKGRGSADESVSWCHNLLLALKIPPTHLHFWC